MNSSTSLFTSLPVGIGTWSWGDRLVWGFGTTYHKEDLRKAFKYCVENGVCFFDTAEVYGQGKSELLLGEFIQEVGRPVSIGTKYMPYPWRIGRRSLHKALNASLKRLQQKQVDLYQIHIPLPPVNIDRWMEAMAGAVQLGYIRWVGVSNFNLAQTQRAYDALKREGITLASNQVEYHLLDRRIEKNGLLDLCRELGVTVIAYSPLAMGVLTGKYHYGYSLKGFRATRYNRQYLERIQPLIQTMKKIGALHQKTISQVAINWTICKGTYPIPGVKNLEQAQQVVGSVGWTLTEEEVYELDKLSNQVTKQGQ